MIVGSCFCLDDNMGYIWAGILTVSVVGMFLWFYVIGAPRGVSK
jgi:hypothetical protein